MSIHRKSRNVKYIITVKDDSGNSLGFVDFYGNKYKITKEFPDASLYSDSKTAITDAQEAKKRDPKYSFFVIENYGYADERILTQAAQDSVNFDAILEKIDATPESDLRAILFKDNEYIDTPGNFQEEKADYDNDIIEYYVANMGKEAYDRLIEYIMSHTKAVGKFMGWLGKDFSLDKKAEWPDVQQNQGLTPVPPVDSVIDKIEEGQKVAKKKYTCEKCKAEYSYGKSSKVCDKCLLPDEKKTNASSEVGLEKVGYDMAKNHHWMAFTENDAKGFIAQYGMNYTDEDLDAFAQSWTETLQWQHDVYEPYVANLIEGKDEKDKADIYIDEEMAWVRGYEKYMEEVLKPHKKASKELSPEQITLLQQYRAIAKEMDMVKLGKSKNSLKELRDAKWSIQQRLLGDGVNETDIRYWMQDQWIKETASLKALALKKGDRAVQVVPPSVKNPLSMNILSDPYNFGGITVVDVKYDSGEKAKIDVKELRIASGEKKVPDKLLKELNDLYDQAIPYDEKNEDIPDDLMKKIDVVREKIDEATRPKRRSTDASLQKKALAVKTLSIDQLNDLWNDLNNKFERGELETYPLGDLRAIEKEIEYRGGKLTTRLSRRLLKHLCAAVDNKTLINDIDEHIGDEVGLTTLVADTTILGEVEHVESNDDDEVKRITIKISKKDADFYGVDEEQEIDVEEGDKYLEDLGLYLVKK